MSIGANSLTDSKFEALFPYLKSIHPRHFEQSISSPHQNYRYSPPPKSPKFRSLPPYPKTTDSRIVRSEQFPYKKNNGGHVHPTPLRFTPNPLSILVVAGG